MNSESNSKGQGTQSYKSTSPKRSHRANNRPILVTDQGGAGNDEPQAVEEEMQPEVPVALQTSEPAEKKHRPAFFLNIGRADKNADQPQADPKAARMARAMRGRSAETAPEKEQAKEKKVTPAASGASRAGAAPTRPRSGFKMRYILGMVAYLLIADFLGVWITNWMVANKLDALVFTIGPFRAERSTLIFLALLVIILVVMAKLDLIPRSLSAMSGGTPAPRKGPGAPPAKAATSTFETKTPQPTMKQGVKGKDDALYQEYRENQRYFQKRDRKR